MSLGKFLTERLKSNGIKTIFGVPGDYILPYLKTLSDDKDVEFVGNTDEAAAGFAADAYARLNGIGCMCVTYCVGGLKVVNTVAGAFAEKSPVVVISGAPAIKDRDGKMLLHHMVRTYACQHEIFKHITCASTVLDDPTKAGYEIDRVLAAAKHHKQPVYIELPKDMVSKSVVYDAYTQGTPTRPSSDEACLQEAVEDTLEWLDNAKKPILWAGVEIARFGLGRKIVKFAEAAGIPLVTDLSSKSVVNESHPLFLGVYSGGISHDPVRRAVEDSDCLIMLGVMMTDINLGFKPTIFQKADKVRTLQDRVHVKNHTYENVQVPDFVNALCSSKYERRAVEVGRTKVATFSPEVGRKVTVARVFEKINSILTDEMAIVADVGDALFGASDLQVHEQNRFLGMAFYTSMGFAIPGALGVQKADPKIRPVVIVGDGAFQMSGAELSTIVKHGLNPIVFVLNNNGYGTERRLMSGKFNDIQNWTYHLFPSIIGGGCGFCVETEEQLEEAVSAAISSDELTILNVVLDQNDLSPALQRMVNLAKK